MHFFHHRHNLDTSDKNPLGTESINSLLPRFIIPCVIAMLVNALYNIVDQIFIGQDLGPIGNAATNVCFPLTTLALALSLLLGHGTASKQNLELGAENQEAAERTVGNMLTLAAIIGSFILVIFLLFLEPLLLFFGATKESLPYAMTYASIIRWGLPFAIASTALNSCIRADGSATYAMVNMLIGAVINTILDPIFIFVLDWGIAGAAYATIVGQIIVCLLALRYIPRFKHLKIRRRHLRLSLPLCGAIFYLGIAGFCNQISMAVVQVVMNNSMVYYGAQSIYGEDIPLAVIGILIKVNMLFFAFTIGIAQGSQPLLSFNYGAKKFDRVKETYKKAIMVATSIAICAFLIFQLLPRQIMDLFGGGSPEYYQFAIKSFRILLFATFVNGIQPVSSIFFTAIGKGTKGTFVALTRQFLFLIPLILVLPRFWGIEGLLYTFPIADFAAVIIALLMVRKEFRNMDSLRKAELLNS